MNNHFKLLISFFITVLFLLVVVLGMSVYTATELAELIRVLLPVLQP